MIPTHSNVVLPGAAAIYFGEFDTPMYGATSEMSDSGNQDGNGMRKQCRLPEFPGENPTKAVKERWCRDARRARTRGYRRREHIA